ncbi:hypothetical protein N9I65_03280 [bacterium]|nr:hypothetical protein [bacterium]
MKICLSILLLVFGCSLASSDEEGFEAYQTLKKETGLTDDQLKDPIKKFAEFARLMEDELEAGSIDPKELIESGKKIDEIIADMQRQDELTAALTFAFLRALETKGADKAAEFMAKELSSFVERDFPDTDGYREIRARIEEYSKSSSAFKRLEQRSEQADDAN